MFAALVWLAAYLVGSIPFGWLVARARGVDIFKEGSGNIGATNVGRVLGKPLGLLVFVLDFAKGAAPTAAAMALGDASLPAGMLEVGAGLAAFLGHLFPIALRFRGGKGVATAAGVVSVLFPLPAFAGFLAFASVVSATRIVSLGSIAAALAIVVAHLLARNAVDPTDPRTAFVLVAMVLVAIRHRGNLARIRSGEERRIGEHPALEPFARSLHVLSLGTWLGAASFFSFVAAPTLFREFDAAAKAPEPWFPRAAPFDSVDGVIDGPKEQGSRAAGYAVAGIFPTYFLWQFFCGVAALGTALGWPRLRPCLAAAALILVCIGWPVERKVAELRQARNAATDAYLHASPAERDDLRPAAVASRSAFVRWHLASLLLNLGAIAILVPTTALAGNLRRPG